MRLPAELKTKLDAAAFENRRSLAAEVATRLQSTFEPAKGSDQIAQALASAELRAATEHAEKLKERLLAAVLVEDLTRALEAAIAGLGVTEKEMDSLRSRAYECIDHAKLDDVERAMAGLRAAAATHREAFWRKPEALDAHREDK